MKNTFANIATRHPQIADVLACAFATSHNPEDIFPALRMARRLVGIDATDWLQGRHLLNWANNLPTLRDAAHDWLDGRLERIENEAREKISEILSR